MTKDLKRRVDALGGADRALNLEGHFDLMQRRDAGEDFDWGKVKIERKLAELLNSFR